MKIIPASVPKLLPRARGRAIPQPGEVITKCGCICLPAPILHILGSREKCVLCDTHGWQKIIRPATYRERIGLGVPLPLQDEPPY